MIHFLLSHALAALFWVPVAWGFLRLKHPANAGRDHHGT
jgi:uncharacterized membrane protein